MLAALVAGVYWQTLWYGFVTDDFYFARPLTLAELASTFYGNWEPKGQGNAHYRPITALSLALDYQVWGPRPLGYHLTNLLLMWLNGVAAFYVLRRLGLGFLGALAGAVIWLVHPLSATAAAWSNQRTDSVMTLFYLLALGALLTETWGRKPFVLFLSFGLLAFGSKEMAITLPVVSAAALLAWRPSALKRRLAAPLTLAALACAYVLAWRVLFPTKVHVEWGALATAPRLLAPVFAPTSYQQWWAREALGWLWIFVLLAFVGAALWRLERDDPSVMRLYALAILWPILTIGPVFGLKDPDIFRLGLLPAFAFALLAALLAHAVRARPWAVSIAAALLISQLVPLARETAAAWGPGGFYYQQGLRWKTNDPNWESRLSPEMQRLFRRQARRDLQE